MIELASTETASGFQKKGRGTRPKTSNMFRETKELQELVFISAKGGGLKPIEQAALARVWKELAELRLRLQGKGPPKAVDYAAKKPKPAPNSASFTETPAQVKPKRAKVVPSPSRPTDTQSNTPANQAQGGG